jgi:hypothetical protein
VKEEEYDINEEEDMCDEDDTEFFYAGWVILSQCNVVKHVTSWKLSLFISLKTVIMPSSF